MASRTSVRILASGQVTDSKMCSEANDLMNRDDSERLFDSDQTAFKSDFAYRYADDEVLRRLSRLR